MYKVAFTIAVILFSLVQRSYAICGGEYCPVRVKKSEEIQYAQTNFYEGFGVNTQYRTVAFDIGGKGYYNALILQPIYFHPRFSIGAILPIIQLYKPGVKNPLYGISNPMVLGEFYALNKETMLAFGSMVELPLGNNEDGMAAAHAMILPYLSVTHAVLKGYVGGMVGYQMSIKGHEHNHSHSVLYVNPHEEEELWSRAFLGWRFGSYTPEILLSYRHALSLHYGLERNFLNIGTIQRYRLSPGIELNLTFEFPILSNERELFRLGGGVYAQVFDLFKPKSN